MSKPKTATKRTAEQNIERYEKKIRRAKQQLENEVAKGFSAHVVGENGDQDSSPTNVSDISDDSPMGVKETSGEDQFPLGLEPDTETRKKVAREAHNSMTIPQTNQRALEADTSMWKAKTAAGLNASPQGQIIPKSSQVRKDIQIREPNEKPDGSRKEDANQKNESHESLETMEKDNSTDNSISNQFSELLNVFSGDFLLTGDVINSKLVEEWNPILQKGLSENVKETILKKYTTPDNCKLLKAPFLNKEVAATIDEHARYRDKNAQTRQEQMGLGLTAMAKGITALIERRDENYVKVAMQHFRQGCMLLADVHFERTRTRRVLCGSSNHDIKDFICGVFGKNLDIRHPSNLSSIDTVFDRDDTLFGLNAGKVFTKCPVSSCTRRRGPHY